MQSSKFDFSARKPKVAFVREYNACRSQIAETLCRHIAGNWVECYSSGTDMKARINPDAVRLAKRPYAIDMQQTQRPRLFADIAAADVAIAMGCNVSCPSLLCPHREDREVGDPTGNGNEAFMQVIRQIEAKNDRRHLKIGLP